MNNDVEPRYEIAFLYKARRTENAARSADAWQYCAKWVGWPYSDDPAYWVMSSALDRTTASRLLSRFWKHMLAPGNTRAQVALTTPAGTVLAADDQYLVAEALHFEEVYGYSVDHNPGQGPILE